MTQEVAGAGIRSEGTLGQRAERRPYVKPIVRNLDVLDTEGKTDNIPTEHHFNTDTFTFFGGPS
jgi:hypothetical protein